MQLQKLGNVLYIYNKTHRQRGLSESGQAAGTHLLGAPRNDSDVALHAFMEVKTPYLPLLATI